MLYCEQSVKRFKKIVVSWDFFTSIRSKIKIWALDIEFEIGAENIKKTLRWYKRWLSQEIDLIAIGKLDQKQINQTIEWKNSEITLKQGISEKFLKITCRTKRRTWKKKQGNLRFDQRKNSLRNPNSGIIEIKSRNFKPNGKAPKRNEY